MRGLRVNGSSHAEPTHRDDLAACLRIDDAVAVAKALPRVSTQTRDETPLRPMLVNVDTNATPMVMIADADIQQRVDD